MTTKVMKYEIIKPIDIDWKLAGEIFNKLQYQSYLLANKTIQMFWDFQNLSFTYKERFGKYLNMKDIPNKYTSIEGDISSQLRNQFINLPSGTFDSVVIKAKNKWNQHKLEILKGSESMVNFKRSFPICLRDRQIKIIKNDENTYILRLSLLSKEYKTELELKKGQIDFLIKAYDNTQKVILERLINNEYKIGASEIFKIKKGKTKWFINITYTFQQEENLNLDKNNIMGIDLGVCNPAYIAFNNSLNRYKIEGNEIIEFRRRIEKRRNELLKQGKYCGEGRIGHGRNTRIKPIEKLRNKVENFKDTTNHKYSRYIIDLALKNNCGVIKMEDLSGIAEGEKKATFLGMWSYYDLQTKIEYKAKEIGIEVIKINPKYTSARCNKCGYIHRSENKDIWRPKQDTFKCMNCDYGHKYFVHADYNAAKNISTPDIEEIINKQLKLQEVRVKFAE